jgi:hypothetical protein
MVLHVTGQTLDLSVIERKREIHRIGRNNIERMVVFLVLVAVKAFR